MKNLIQSPVKYGAGFYYRRIYAAILVMQVYYGIYMQVYIIVMQVYYIMVSEALYEFKSSHSTTITTTASARILDVY